MGLLGDIRGRADSHFVGVWLVATSQRSTDALRRPPCPSEAATPFQRHPHSLNPYVMAVHSVGCSRYEWVSACLIDPVRK